MTRDDKFIRFFDGEGEGDGKGAGDGDGKGSGGGGTGDAGGGGGDGGGTPTLPDGAFFADQRFRDALPEDIRGHEGFAKVANLEGMARSFLSGQKMTGMDPNKFVEVPKPEDADAVRAVMTRLGLPGEAKDFTLSAPKDVTAGFGPSEPLAKGFAEAAHKAGILPSQAQGIYEWFTGTMGETMTGQETAKNASAEENVRVLEGKWGAAFDQKVAVANFAIDKLGGEDLRKVFNEAGVGTNPLVMEALVKIGGMLAEDSGEGGEGSGEGAGRFGSALTPSEATSKARELIAQSHEHKAFSPERKRLQEEAQRFFALANPKKSGT